MPSNKNILFRIDGGNKTGMGHVKRALTLSVHLREKYKITSHFFLCGDKDAFGFIKRYTDNVDYYPYIEPKQEDIIDLSVIKAVKEDCSLIVTDLFSMKEKEDYSYKIKKSHIYHLVFDDLLLNKIKGDLVINPSIVEKKIIYRDAAYYQGFEYSIFNRLDLNLNTNQTKGNILVSMGGSDPGNITKVIVDSIVQYNIKGNYFIFIGPAFSIGLKKYLYSVENKNIQFIEGAGSLDNNINDLDFAIVSGGLTLYELTACGIPCLIISQNRFQEMTSLEFDRRGLALNLGRLKDIRKNSLSRIINLFLLDRTKREEISKLSRSVMDTEGVKRVGEIVKKVLFSG